MDVDDDDPNRALTLDGNALAGKLLDLFGHDMTANDAECAHCGGHHMMGEMIAFTHAPGMVLRCPSCGEVMLTLVETPRGIYLDVRGSAVIHMAAASRAPR